MEKKLFFFLKSKYLYIALLFIVCSPIFSQTYTLNDALNNTIQTTCSGTFYDSGGSSGNYGNNEYRTVTFFSSNPSQSIYLIFTQFDIELL
jgi:hypothetical protein